VTFRLFFRIQLFLVAAGLGCAIAEPSPSPSPSKSPRLASFKERLAAAETVKVKTSILGLELDSSLEKAHETLDPLTDPAKPSVEAAEEAEHEEKEHKVLWQLTKSEFSSVLLKTDDKERVTYITGFLRPGKEIPFGEIGQTEKAPILTDRTVAWDVVRPNQPLIRVVARGEKRKAASITIFIVKRAPSR
jgi:hypothetical protein